MRLTFDEIFAPTYKGKLFQVKPGHVAYTIEFDADPITPEGKDIQRLVKAHWKEEMAAFKKEKEKLYSEAITATEKKHQQDLRQEMGEGEGRKEARTLARRRGQGRQRHDQECHSDLRVDSEVPGQEDF